VTLNSYSIDPRELVSRVFELGYFWRGRPVLSLCCGPARYLLENQASLLSGLNDATVDRFEDLFDRINRLLP
jgi:hypothetical protein